MDTVDFKVIKDDVVKEFTIEVKTTIEDLKNMIKDEYNILSYIDIDFQIEKPMRVLGKFNVEPGILARTFDRYELDKFGIKDEINLTFHEVKDYTPQSLSKNKINLTRLTSLTNNDDRVDFNINSEEDFPKLG
tara:strand:- start:150 stop:548 length:399 start_codon:yes stop_codon:yes gene_type:complete